MLTVDEINARLEAAKAGVKVVCRGNRLCLRATLPDPNGGKPRQQFIALGIYANQAGLKQAEAEAKIVSGLLATGRFDWNKYRQSETQSVSIPSSDIWIKKFQEDYFQRKGDTPNSRATWKMSYDYAFRDIQGKEFTPENLIKAISSIPIDSRKRRMVCERLGTLAKFAGLNVNLSPYIGNYGPDKITPRVIPSTAEIEQARSLFSRSDKWQWAFEVYATYGIRPHELFFCEISPEFPHILTVTEGKTGSREVYPYHPHWAVDWRLYETFKPKCTGKTYQEFGSRVTAMFGYYKVPFSAYCLRHAYCIRLSTEYNIPLAIAASWAGHDPAVYLRSYQRWIGQAEKRRVFEESLKNKS